MMEPLCDRRRIISRTLGTPLEEEGIHVRRV
jgi:hypothetical protein